MHATTQPELATPPQSSPDVRVSKPVSPPASKPSAPTQVRPRVQPANDGDTGRRRKSGQERGRRDRHRLLKQLHRYDAVVAMGDDERRLVGVVLGCEPKADQITVRLLTDEHCSEPVERLLHIHSLQDPMEQMAAGIGVAEDTAVLQPAHRLLKAIGAPDLSTRRSTVETGMELARATAGLSPEQAGRLRALPKLMEAA